MNKTSTFEVPQYLDRTGRLFWTTAPNPGRWCRIIEGQRDQNQNMSRYSVVPNALTSLGTEASAATAMNKFVSRIQTK